MGRGKNGELFTVTDSAVVIANPPDTKYFSTSP